MRDEFNINDIRGKDMEKLADDIEDYIEVFKSIMIIPDDVKDKHEDDIKAAIKMSEKLIKKLRCHDTSVFKSPDEWNSIS